MSSLLTTAVALALVAPAAPPPAAAAPAPAPVAAAPAPAPAPGPVAAAPAPTAAPVVTAPAPGPIVAAPAPATSTSNATSTTTVVPAGTSVTVNVFPPPPVAAPEPEPEPAPVVVAPPPPVYTPPVSTEPDPALVQASIRKFRRGAIGVMAVGSIGMGVALALQWARLANMDSCIRSNRASGYDTGSCRGDDLDIVGGYYGALGMAVFVGGAAGGGVMLGNAAAHRDVQLYKGTPRRRTGAKLLGAASIVAGAAWMIGANWTLLGKEAQCETGECLMKYRPLRYAANDSGALAIGLGSALVGYGVAYDKQGRALMKLRAAPTLTRTTAGLSLTGRF